MKKVFTVQPTLNLQDDRVYSPVGIKRDSLHPDVCCARDQLSANPIMVSIAVTATARNAGLLGPDLWPPNSPDLNPVDYTVWGCYAAESV